MSKVLIRKQQGIQYQQQIAPQQQRGSFGRDLATLGGGAVGLNAQGGQGFVSGRGQVGRPTRMQRLGAGANLAGRGLAAALTGLQTAHSLQGGNVGAIASARDQYRANVGGLTGGQPTEMQRTQDMATGMYNTEEEERLRQQIRNSATQAQRSLPQQPQPNVPLPTSVPNPNSAGPAQPVAVTRPPVFSSAPPSPHPAGNRPPGMPQPAQAGVVNVGGGTLNPNMVAPIQSPAAPTGVPTSAPVGSEAQPTAEPAMTPEEVAGTIPQPPPTMFQQPAPAAPAPTPAAPTPAAPTPAAPAPARVAVQKPVENNWEEQESWLDEEPTFNDNRRVDNTGKTAVLRPIRRGMGESNYSDDWDLTPEEIQRQKEFDEREQERRFQPRELTPSPGARPKSTLAGNFIRPPSIPMGQERPPVVVKPPVNTGGMGSNPIEDAKIPSLKDNPLFTGSGKNFGVPLGSNQERLNRIASNNAFDSAYEGQERQKWVDKYTPHPLDRVQKPFWDSVSDDVFTNSFTQMIFNEFGDMLRKADPHVAGLLAMRIYMDKFMR